MSKQFLLNHTNQNKRTINQTLFKNDSIILPLALFIDLLNWTFAYMCTILYRQR